MAQQIDIGDYVNLNLDQNDMATSLNNLHNEHYSNQERGSQMMDNLMNQIENIPQTQPQQMMMKQPQQIIMQQPQQIMQQPQQMMMQQPQQIMMQQPQQNIPINLYNNGIETEKNKVLKDLDITESDKYEINNIKLNNEIIDIVDKEIIEKKVEIKSFTSHIKETILVVLLYIIIGNDYINLYITKYITYLNDSPLIIFIIKAILIGLLFHLIRWFMK